ncbi:MAG: nuclear transport factor 2 family protein [Myxococcota bacterium]
MAASNDHIRQTIDRYIEFMNAADFDSIAELYSEDATLEDPVGTEPRQGREAIRKFYADAVGNVALELTGKPRVAAGQVAFPMHARIGGTGILEIIDVMVFNDDGLITSMRAFWSSDEFQPVP